MKRQLIPVGSFEANCTVLWNEEVAVDADAKRPCWIVDPGADAEEIIRFCEATGLSPVLAAFTHGHFDHIGAIPDLLAKWPALPMHMSADDARLAFCAMNSYPPYYPQVERPSTLVTDLEGDAVLSAGGISAKVISTPGHTPGGVCLYFEREGLLLAGDTLFAGSCGRTDLPGGNMSQLLQSLKRLSSLPPTTEVVSGHGAGTTIGREVSANPFMR